MQIKLQNQNIITTPLNPECNPNDKVSILFNYTDVHVSKKPISSIFNTLKGKVTSLSTDNPNNNIIISVNIDNQFTIQCDNTLNPEQFDLADTVYIGIRPNNIATLKIQTV